MRQYDNSILRDDSRLPNANEVAAELKAVAKSVDDECDVRLQVYPSGRWAVRWGSSDYDQDHTGFWGAGCVYPHDAACPQDYYASAVDLIDQVADMLADETAVLNEKE